MPLSNLQKNLSHYKNVVEYSLLMPEIQSPLYEARRHGRHISPQTSLYTNFIVRPNAFYRSHMTKLLHDFYHETEPPFYTNSSCVTVHMRRGDRILKDMDMNEYCKKCRLDKNCIGDLGCEKVAFGQLDIFHVIEKVDILLNFKNGKKVRNLVVMTDDPKWLMNETIKLKQKHPEWNVYSLGLPKDLMTNIDEKNDSTARDGIPSTASGVELFASRQLIQQCSAFIGHFGSSAASLLFESMCLKHNGWVHTCPPVYNFEMGLDLPKNSSS
jgi:hypothetical protein